MHPVLLDSLSRIEARLKQDERCVGMYLWGSMSNGSADEWSDVDVGAVFRDEDYTAVKEGIRALCEEECGPIVGWLPEGETEGFVNEAFLFDVDGRVHLYDFTICSIAYMQKTAWMRPQQILFDRTGDLAAAAQRPAAPPYDAGGLRHQIIIWWVYTYLNGKYYKRGDTYKMLYVQGVIFQMHMKVLHAFYPDREWVWWARDIHTLPQAQQDALRVYFGAVEPDDIAQALKREMDLFSLDAQAACQRWSVIYPAELERGVRKHLSYMGVVP
jgi:predicted nucleotidyltransferase